MTRDEFIELIESLNFITFDNPNMSESDIRLEVIYYRHKYHQHIFIDVNRSDLFYITDINIDIYIDNPIILCNYLFRIDKSDIENLLIMKKIKRGEKLRTFLKSL